MSSEPISSGPRKKTRSGGASEGAKVKPGTRPAAAAKGTLQREFHRRRRELWTLAAALILAAGAAVYGLFLDRSIRNDPFAPPLSSFGSIWDWFTHNQAHPALATIPVVPVGARGVLTYRPPETGWINSPYPPDSIPLPPTGEQPEPEQQPQDQQRQPSGQQQQQQQQQQLPQTENAEAQPFEEDDPDAERLGARFLPSANPSGAPRIVHAQCLPRTERGPGACFLIRENDGQLYRNDFTEDGWQPWGTPQPGPPIYFEFDAAGQTAIVAPADPNGRFLRSVDGGAAWTEENFVIPDPNFLNFLRYAPLPTSSASMLDFFQGPHWTYVVDHEDLIQRPRSDKPDLSKYLEAVMAVVSATEPSKFTNPTNFDWRGPSF